MNFNITVENNVLRVENPQPIEYKDIWFAVIDMDCNLVKDLIWGSFPPNSHILSDLSKPGPACNGYRIEVFVDEGNKETQQVVEVIWGDVDKKNFFHNSSRELNYMPFIDLFYNDEYGGKIVIIPFFTCFIIVFKRISPINIINIKKFVNVI